MTGRWTSLHGDVDGFEEAERRLVESNPALAELLVEMTDDEVGEEAVRLVEESRRRRET